MTSNLQNKIKKEISNRLYSSIFTKIPIIIFLVILNSFFFKYIFYVFRINITFGILQLGYTSWAFLIIIFLLIDFFNTNLIHSQEYCHSIYNAIFSVIWPSYNIILNVFTQTVLYFIMINLIFNTLKTNNSNELSRNKSNSIILINSLALYITCFFIIILTLLDPKERILDLKMVIY